MPSPWPVDPHSQRATALFKGTVLAILWTFNNRGGLEIDPIIWSARRPNMPSAPGSGTNTGEGFNTSNGLLRPPGTPPEEQSKLQKTP